MWEHVVQYRYNNECKVEFILKIQDEFDKIKQKTVKEEEIEQMLYNIRMFLVNCKEEFMTNQSYISFQNIFRGFIIKVWSGTNFGSKKYVKYNKVSVNY